MDREELLKRAAEMLARMTDGQLAEFVEPTLPEPDPRIDAWKANHYGRAPE